MRAISKTQAALTLSLLPGFLLWGEQAGETAGSTEHIELAEAALLSIDPLGTYPTFLVSYDIWTDYFNTGKKYSEVAFDFQLPIRLYDDWTLNNRGTLRLDYLEQVFPGIGGRAGLGDTTYAGLLVPSEPFWGIYWGFGPQVNFPTGDETAYTFGKYTIGPSVTAQRLDGNALWGVSVTQNWSVAGDSTRSNVSYTEIVPFVTYTFDTGTFIGTAPEIYTDWYAPSSQRWIVPVGGVVGQAFPVRDALGLVYVGAYYTVEGRQTSWEWQYQIGFQLLFGN